MIEVKDPRGVSRDGDIFEVPGVRGAAVASGVKPSGDVDLALIVFDEPMSAAGVFTTSATAAPPVVMTRAQLARTPRARAIVINSGNANALTGERGMRDAEQMREAAARVAGGEALVLSTGVIGVPLPTERVLDGIARAATELADDGATVARAMLTTDTCEKRAVSRVSSGGDELVVGGLAKGSGMIHPNMATMLAVIATDAPLTPAATRALLERAVDRSFHEISVDGDTSTNDAVLLVANAPSAERPPLEGDDIEALQGCITDVARSLALQVVGDGEGATRLMEIRVEGAKDRAEARAVASTIGRSPLVKTALAGGDPNWGRILGAAGNAGVALDVARLSLRIGHHEVFRGAPLEVDRALLEEQFAGEQVSVQLSLGRGSARGRMVTTDLTHRYIEINAEYTT